MATDLLTGVLAGLALALLRTVLSLAHLEIKVDLCPNGSAIVHLSGAATFLSLPKLSAALEKIEKGRDVSIQLDRLLFLDHACLTALEEFTALHERQGGNVMLEREALQVLGADERLRLAG